MHTSAELERRTLLPASVSVQGTHGAIILEICLADMLCSFPAVRRPVVKASFESFAQLSLTPGSYLAYHV